MKRISLQLRTRSAESQPAISDTPPTTPSSSQEYSHSAKAESVGKGPRPSRLKPTVPLHMTTRRHKSGLQSSVLTQSKQATKIASPSTEAEEHTIVQKMPPKRISSVVSGAQETDEHLKKRLRGPQAPKTNGISHSNAGPKEANDTPRVDALKLASSVHKRPRGRPPLRPKASLPTIEKVNTATNTPTTSRKESSYVQEVPESISNTTSRAASDIVRPKVPKKTLFDQYHSKHQLALKHATTEQLRRRQSRIQQQYNLLAQLAKKNNALLIEKSIEILNNISDVDLARTEWVASILAGLEKAEEARMKQIHFDKKVSLINAFHTYDAERQRIEAEYQVCHILYGVAS